jgi:hypothetical protein
MPTPVDEATVELKALVARVEARVQSYLGTRADQAEQRDHLRHVADRTRWLYYSELQHQTPGASVRVAEHEDELIEACVISHDIGKWVPRADLSALLPDDSATQTALFHELHFTDDQTELLLLGVRRRLALEHDGYVPEYDSAHHLVSAYMLVADPGFDIHRLAPDDQERLIRMIVGHQFGSYFKEQLLNLSLHDDEVTTGMLVDVARPDRVVGDLLASAFHDADISDLLFVGSLERRPNREDLFHTGGLVKILMINFTNLLFNAPRAPTTLAACLRSCQFTVTTACEEFLTQTAIEHGVKWRKEARRFLDLLREKSVEAKFEGVLFDQTKTVPERLQALRMLAYLQAREFLRAPEED